MTNFLLVAILIGVCFAVDHMQSLRKDIQILREELYTRMSNIEDSAKYTEINVRHISEDINQLSEVKTRREIEFDNRYM